MGEEEKVRITRAEREDAKEFYQLEARCFEMAYDDWDTMYYWTPILEHMYCLKAVTDGRIVGGVVSMPTYGDGWYVNSLCVAPEHRRRGIARRLMDDVIGAAGNREITLDVKTDGPHLLKFYGSLGFERRRLSRNHYRDSSDRFILVRAGAVAADAN